MPGSLQPFIRAWGETDNVFAGVPNGELKSITAYFYDPPGGQGSSPLRPFEAQIFVRDPEEAAQKLMKLWKVVDILPELLPTWNGSAYELRYPQALALQSHNAVQWYPLDRAYFRRSKLDALVGRAAEPSGQSSVKAARVVRPGLYSAIVNYTQQGTNIAAALQSQLTNPGGFTTDQCNSKSVGIGIEEIRLDYVTAAATLRHDPNDVDSSRGGFFLNVAAFIRQGAWWGEAFVRQTQMYEWVLDNGFVQLQPQPFLMPATCSGGAVCNNHWVPAAWPLIWILLPGARDTLQDVLWNRVPFLVGSTAVNPTGGLQWLDPIALASAGGTVPVPFPLLNWFCDPTLQPSGMGAGGAPFDPCGGARESMFSTVNPLSNIAAQGVNELDSIGFRNWRCVAAGSPNQATDPGAATAWSNAGGGQCQYALRAKRLIPHPDELEIVFLDSEMDFSNPPTLALKLFFQSLAQLAPGLQVALNGFKLPCGKGQSPPGCIPTTLYTPFQRPFYVLQQGSNSGIAGCIDKDLCNKWAGAYGLSCVFNNDGTMNINPDSYYTNATWAKCVRAGKCCYGMGLIAGNTFISYPWTWADFVGCFPSGVLGNLV